MSRYADEIVDRCLSRADTAFLTMGQIAPYASMSELMTQAVAEAIRTIPDDLQISHVELAAAILSARPISTPDGRQSPLPIVPGEISTYLEDLDADGNKGGRKL